MSSRRVQKVAEAVRQAVSTAILTELWDPRVRNVTVTHVEVSGDLRHAKVYVSVMGTETQQQLAVRGLQHAGGFLQSKVAENVRLRYTPTLEFTLDHGVKRSIEMSQLISRVMAESKAQNPELTVERSPPENEDVLDGPEAEG